MKNYISSIVVVLLLLLLFADKPSDAQRLLRSIWRRFTRNTENGRPNTMPGRQEIVSRQDVVPASDDTVRPIQIPLTDATESQQETEPYIPQRRSSLFIDGTSLDFVYWNKELGNNKPIIIEFGNEKQILNYWVRGKPLKVITHGWLGTDEDDKGVFGIKTAYVATENCNVITADWNRVSGNYMYPMPAYQTARVGSIIAELLEHFVQLAVIDPSDIHVIGHSLGAHVSGACGAAFSLGKIGRITGLDPAGPGFEYVALRSDHLDSTDAQFVDVIHTASGTAGYSSPIGHADFYPNEGSPPQPGCLESYMPTALVNLIGCSHSRAHEFYADSVYNRKSYSAVECPSWEEYTSGVCKNNTHSFMGHDADPKARGIFYLQTNSTSPFGILERVL